jgi:hypothetical protein
MNWDIGSLASFLLFKFHKSVLILQGDLEYVSHAGTLLPLSWIISIMGAGFQNIVGAVVFRISKPKGFGHVLRAMGLTLYAVGWFDIRIIEAGFLNPIASDFATFTIIKLILYLFLNYYLIRYVIGGSTSQTDQFSLFDEFMIQAGYRKRSDVAMNSTRKKRKRRLNNFGTEFLYQAGIKQRPSQFRSRNNEIRR